MTTLEAEASTGPGLYLLHLEPPYRHAGHYLGYADNIARRVREHVDATRRSSPLVRAAIGADCTVTLARTWPGGDRTLERRLKRHHGLRPHCPICTRRER